MHWKVSTAAGIHSDWRQRTGDSAEHQSPEGVTAAYDSADATGSWGPVGTLSCFPYSKRKLASNEKRVADETLGR